MLKKIHDFYTFDREDIILVTSRVDLKVARKRSIIEIISENSFTLLKYLWTTYDWPNGGASFVFLFKTKIRWQESFTGMTLHNIIDKTHFVLLQGITSYCILFSFLVVLARTYFLIVALTFMYKLIL